jgi:hypothetical protein
MLAKLASTYNPRYTTLNEATGLSDHVFVKTPTVTKRQRFLQEVEQVIVWGLWTSRIAQHDPRAGLGRPSSG